MIDKVLPLRKLILFLLLFATHGEHNVFTNSCANSSTWKTKKQKDCNWVAKKPSKRCKITGLDKTKANSSCQVACNTCSCVNDSTWRYKMKNGNLKGCNWVKKYSRRCKKKGVDNTKAKESCRLACGTCVPPTSSPTSNPTNQSFTIDKSTYSAGDSIVATLKGFPGNERDWIGIFKRDAPPTSYELYAYVGTGDGEFVLPRVPLYPGDYDARIFLDNGYIDAAPPIPFKVIEGNNSDLSGQGGGKKAIFIGIDGVRPDQLSQAKTPNIDALVAGGAYDDDARTSSRVTSSGPGWADMMLGVNDDKHRIFGNSYRISWNLEKYPSWIARLELEKPNLRTAAVINWELYASYIKDVDSRSIFEGYSIGYDVSDRLVTNKAVDILTNSDPDAMIVTFGYTDALGHAYGSFSPKTLEGIETADDHIGEIMAAIYSRPSFNEEDWLIQIGTDHGRTQGGSHGGISKSEKRIFFLASGTGSAGGGTILKGATNVDHAANLLTHMLGDIDPSWGLDGSAKGLTGMTNPKVSVEKRVYPVAEDITVFFTGGPGNAKDWIGIYPANSGAPYPGSSIWKYVDSSATDGSILFSSPSLDPGEYEAYFLENDSYKTLAGPAIFSIESSVSVNKRLHSVLEDITVLFTGGPGNAKDWIGIYPANSGAPYSGSSIRKYVENSATDGSILFSSPSLDPGEYEAYFLENDSYKTLAGPAIFTVSTKRGLVSTDKAVYRFNEDISVTFADGPGNEFDWIGIYPANSGAPYPGSSIWKYVENSATDGSILFSSPDLDHGDYEAYFLEDDTYNILAAPAMFTVTAQRRFGLRG